MHMGVCMTASHRSPLDQPLAHTLHDHTLHDTSPMPHAAPLPQPFVVAPSHPTQPAHVFSHAEPGGGGEISGWEIKASMPPAIFCKFSQSEPWLSHRVAVRKWVGAVHAGVVTAIWRNFLIFSHKLRFLARVKD